MLSFSSSRTGLMILFYVHIYRRINEIVKTKSLTPQTPQKPIKTNLTLPHTHIYTYAQTEASQIVHVFIYYLYIYKRIFKIII